MIGMLFAMKVSEDVLEAEVVPEGFMSWIEQLGYANWHVTLNKGPLLLETMKKDKKTKGQNIRMVLLERCGRARIEPIREEDIVQHLATFRTWLNR
jgi:3-dehydroquinate synthase